MLNESIINAIKAYVNRRTAEIILVSSSFDAVSDEVKIREALMVHIIQSLCNGMGLEDFRSILCHIPELQSIKG